MYLPKVIKFNSKEPEAAARYAKIAKFINLPGTTDEELTDALIARLLEMNKALDIPACIKDYEGGIIDEKEFMDKLPKVAELAVGDACTGSNRGSRFLTAPFCVTLHIYGLFLLPEKGGKEFVFPTLFTLLFLRCQKLFHIAQIPAQPCNDEYFQKTGDKACFQEEEDGAGCHHPQDAPCPAKTHPVAGAEKAEEANDTEGQKHR